VNASELKTLILCGGLATRMGRAGADVPKAILPVGGRPFIGYLFDQIRRAGLDKVVLATGHLHEQVERLVGDGAEFGLSVSTSHETHPLGTAGAVVHALGLLGESFLVMNGDSFLDFELGRFVSAHASGGAPAMVLIQVPDRGRYGTVEVRDGRVAAFREKDESRGGLINAGIYLLRKRDLARLEPGRSLSLERDVFPSWVGKVEAFVASGYFVDIGTPESYAAVKEGFQNADQ